MSASLLINRGIVHAKKGDHDRAIADFTKALELDSEYAAAWFNRGNSYAAKGDHNRAIADFTKALELDSEYAAAWFNRGNAYAKKSDHDNAYADFSRAVELNPEYAKILDKRESKYSAREIMEEQNKMSGDIEKDQQTRRDLLAKLQKMSARLYGGAAGLVLGIIILQFVTRMACDAYSVMDSILVYSCNAGNMSLYQLIPLAAVITLALGPYYWQLAFVQKDLERKKDALDELQRAFREKTFGLRMDKNLIQYQPSGTDSKWTWHSPKPGKPPMDDYAQ